MIDLPDYLSEGAFFLTDDIALKQTTTGYLFMHRIPEEPTQAAPGWCVGSFTFDRWTLVQREPLTVSPSILCVDHGTHGFIRDGEWIPA